MPFFSALRPKQWVKNFLIFAAPFAAGRIYTSLSKLIFGLITFCAASSFVYLSNDWRDREQDRKHSKKKHRPFASGALGLPALLLLSFTCILVILGFGIFLPLAFQVILGVYLVVSFSYTFFFKNMPVIEMFFVAFGFFTRALAGSAIIGLPPTGWFVISVGFTALFITACKRLGEFKNQNPENQRLVMKQYSIFFLGSVVNSALSITLLTYSLWVFDVYRSSTLAHITILPFSISMFTYLWICENGDAETPENLFFSNKLLLINLSLIAIAFGVLIYR
jgi:decaprenyl-phosphate phosphoribosyltransferase